MTEPAIERARQGFPPCAEHDCPEHGAGHPCTECGPYCGEPAGGSMEVPQVPSRDLVERLQRLDAPDWVVERAKELVQRHWGEA